MLNPSFSHLRLETPAVRALPQTDPAEPDRARAPIGPIGLELSSSAAPNKCDVEGPAVCRGRISLLNIDWVSSVILNQWRTFDTVASDSKYLSYVSVSQSLLLICRWFVWPSLRFFFRSFRKPGPLTGCTSLSQGCSSRRPGFQPFPAPPLWSCINYSYNINGLVEGKIYRKPWFLPLNMGLSCKFSHNPILWIIWLNNVYYEFTMRLLWV